MNAAVALNVPVKDLVGPVDTTTLCLSKGLGAPVGSLLAGPADFIHEARRARKAFGGGMRQAGVLAAAGQLAVSRGPEWLREDHRRARALATGLAEMPWLRVSVDATETNIVMAHVAAELAAPALRHLEQRGGRDAMAGPHRIRFVLHRVLDDEGVQRCLEACSEFSNPRTESTQ